MVSTGYVTNDLAHAKMLPHGDAPIVCCGLQEGLDAVREVIYHLETYDTTTIRASTPMFLMSRKIKVRMISMRAANHSVSQIHTSYVCDALSAACGCFITCCC